MSASSTRMAELTLSNPNTIMLVASAPNFPDGMVVGHHRFAQVTYLTTRIPYPL